MCVCVWVFAGITIENLSRPQKWKILQNKNELFSINFWGEIISTASEWPLPKKIARYSFLMGHSRPLFIIFVFSNNWIRTADQRSVSKVTGLPTELQPQTMLLILYKSVSGTVGLGTVFNTGGLQVESSNELF